MAAIEIECLLGKIGSPDRDVEIDTSHAVPNSSRWIINVRHDAKAVQAFSLQLLDHRTQIPKKSGFVSPSLVPLDALAASAHLRVTQPDLPILRFELDPVEGVVKYRVTLDTTHSLLR